MPNIGDIVKASDFEAIKPQLSIGTVTTGAAGTNAGASITGTSPNFKLNLTIPRGANGTNGQSGVLGTQVFTASTTVTVPTGATKAVLSGCGGGGGCASRTSSGGVYYGGHAAGALLYPVAVSSQETISITIGAGGKAAMGSSAKSTAGGVTSFGNKLSLSGGSGADVAAQSSGSNSYGPTGADAVALGFGTARSKKGFGYGGYNPQSDGGAGFLIVTWAK